MPPITTIIALGTKKRLPKGVTFLHARRRAARCFPVAARRIGQGRPEGAVMPSIPTQRFTDRAVDYALARPSYSDAALGMLFAGFGDLARLVVADLGAGTGISSRLLAARVERVFAVEPNAAMRESAEPSPNVTWIDGTAENTGLEAASVDLVSAFQAFHWFNPRAALCEMTRILRPGGRGAIVYNERDERDAFTGAYGELVRQYATDKTESRRDDGRSAFQAHPGWNLVRVSETANLQNLDRPGLHARARSTSYLPNDGVNSAKLHAQIDELFDEHSADGFVTMVMKTMVTTGDLAARCVGSRSL